jgi:prefoldin subunit 5
LRQQFKEVTKKLLDKYHEELQREDKIKIFQKQLLDYEKQVKELQHKLELKTKQLEHLRQLLVAEDQKLGTKDS